MTTLSALGLGSATISPTFSSDVFNYTASTSNATNKVTATATDASMAIVIMNGDAEVGNGESASWDVGENTLTITVGGVTTYTVTVTRSGE